MLGKILAIVPGLVGGVVGGLIGVLIFEWGVKQGFYALIIPGALVGLGCGLASPVDSKIRGVINALVAILFGLLAEWRFAPFKADKSFTYLISHVHELKPMTLLMVGIGGVVGFWWGRERIVPRKGKPEARETEI